MNERLTYKIEEVYGDQLGSYLYSIYFNLFTISIDDLADAFYNVGELIGKTLSEILKQLQDYFAESEEQYEIEQKRNKLRAAKAIKPTHKAPVYKIIPYVRNRC